MTEFKTDADIEAFLDGRKPFWHGPKRNQYPAISLRNREKGAFNIQAKSASIHKLIICPLAGLVADHINRDTADFRRENLRLVTYQKNAWNGGKRDRKGVPNGLPKGVHKHWKKYRAKICVNRVPTRSGVFDTPEEAGRAYDEMARRLHGEFAVLNYPTS